MNDPMRILKADHREVEKLLKKLGDSEEGAERQAMVDELTMKLNLHMELEESIVYPMVREHVGEEDEEEADVEHQLTRDGVEKLNAMVDAPGFGAVVEMLMGGIGHHVHEEENEILPELKDEMGREEWVAMGDAIAEARAAAGMPVPEPTRRKSSKRSTSSKTSSRGKAKASSSSR